LNIRPPQEPQGIPKRITDNDISSALVYFKEYKYGLQFRTLIKLGADSGVRAEELFQLRESDRDLEKRMVNIYHKPEIGQTTKTGKNRFSFFTKGTGEMIKEYLTYKNDGCNLKKLFSQRHCHRHFKNSPIQV
jgi:integrase